MLAGIPPFFDETPYGIYQQIIKGKLKFPRSFDAKAADLVSGLLTMDPTRRLGERPPGLPPPPHPLERVAFGPRCWQRNPFPRPARRGVRPGCPLPPAPLCPFRRLLSNGAPQCNFPASRRPAPGARTPAQAVSAPAPLTSRPIASSPASTGAPSPAALSSPLSFPTSGRMATPSTSPRTTLTLMTRPGCPPPRSRPPFARSTSSEPTSAPRHAGCPSCPVSPPPHSPGSPPWRLLLIPPPSLCMHLLNRVPCDAKRGRSSPRSP